MVSIADLVDDRREVEAKFPKSTLRVVYRPSAYTAELESELRAHFRSDQGGMHSQWALVLERLVIDWDLKEKETDKKSIPIEKESLAKLPGVIIKPIYDAIMDDYFPNLTSARNSSDGS